MGGPPGGGTVGGIMGLTDKVGQIVNIWINDLNFYHFLQFTVGKPELITT